MERKMSLKTPRGQIKKDLEELSATAANPHDTKVGVSSSPPGGMLPIAIEEKRTRDANLTPIGLYRPASLP
jgi:hypothetical protein